MPTENRSSNTEMAAKLSPCPFCGETPQITKHHREDIYCFMHRCQVLGPISWGFCEDQYAHIEKWNSRAQPADMRQTGSFAQRHENDRANQHQGEPVHMVRSHGSCCWEEASGEGLDICLSILEEYEVRKLYSSPAQGEPVAWMARALKGSLSGELVQVASDAKVTPDLYEGPFPVFRHADPGEVERLKKELLVARAQGRAEVVEMITELDAETGLDDFIGSHAIADTGDYGSHWNEDDLRQHFNVDPAAASELEMCRYSAHQIIQLEREEEQLRTHITTQKSWMDRFVEYLTESGVPEDLLA